jgi:hypothetical protein
MIAGSPQGGVFPAKAVIAPSEQGCGTCHVLIIRGPGQRLTASDCGYFSESKINHIQILHYLRYKPVSQICKEIPTLRNNVWEERDDESQISPNIAD